MENSESVKETAVEKELTMITTEELETISEQQALKFEGLINMDYLKEQHVIVIGTGAVGSFLLDTLSRYGLAITAADFDVVSGPNTHNQFFRIQDIGKPKVVALQDRLREDRNYELSIVNDKITKENFKTLLTNKTKFVVLAVDSADSTKELLDHIYTNKETQDLIVLRPGVPDTISDMIYATGVTNLITKGTYQDYMSTLTQTDKELEFELLAALEEQKVCTSQQYTILIQLVSTACAQLIFSLLFVDQNSLTAVRLARQYEITGLLPKIKSNNTY
ncbi:MAG TPA: ThiF family adenylyltransferase [Burkholderiales bacterium]|nr:ThiF family adenylyltransferase [Burkholderiales bacterium]